MSTQLGFTGLSRSGKHGMLRGKCQRNRDIKKNIFLKRECVTTSEGKKQEPKKRLAFQSQRSGSRSRPERRKALPQDGTRKRPNLVLMSTATDSFILVKFIVPSEDRMDLSKLSQ